MQTKKKFISQNFGNIENLALALESPVALKSWRIEVSGNVGLSYCRKILFPRGALTKFDIHFSPVSDLACGICTW